MIENIIKFRLEDIDLEKLLTKVIIYKGFKLIEKCKIINLIQIKLENINIKNININN